VIKEDIMNIIPDSNNSLRFVVGLACFVVVVAGIREASDILVPFMLSVFIAISCAPLLAWLRKCRVPNILAIALIMAIISFAAFILITYIGNSMTAFVRRLPIYQTQLQSTLSDYIDWLAKYGIEISKEVVFQYFNPSVAMRLAGTTIMRLRGILTDTFFILLTVIFILMEASNLPRKMAAAAHGNNDSADQLGKIAAKINRYLTIKSITSFTTGVLIASVLYAVGLDFPLLWGLVAFLFNYVPAIGPVIAAIPALLLGFIQLGWVQLEIIIFGYIAINTAIGNFIEPRIFGKTVGLSPLIVFISLIFWGWVLGPVGMLFSVPLTMVMKIILEANEETRWIAILLGTDADLETGEEVSQEAD
jgi:predicted PurR-regulated permease PerM